MQHEDFNYHGSFQRLVVAYCDCQHEVYKTPEQSRDVVMEQSKSLNFENDLQYFMSEYPSCFTAPNFFQFIQFEGDDVSLIAKLTLGLHVLMYVASYIGLTYCLASTDYTVCLCPYIHAYPNPMGPTYPCLDK